jgi:hypothetical protein
MTEPATSKGREAVRYAWIEAIPTNRQRQRAARSEMSVEKVAAAIFAIRRVYWPTGEPELSAVAELLRAALSPEQPEVTE